MKSVYILVLFFSRRIIRWVGGLKREEPAGSTRLTKRSAVRELSGVVGLIGLCCIAGPLRAQSVSFPDDSRKRGYYDRPYKRYEAEPGKCASDGRFLSPTYVQTELQSEASNAVALQLIDRGSYVQWVNDETAGGMVIRFSLPDSREGKGLKGRLVLFIDDRFVQDISLDSYWAWQYAALAGGQTYPDNLPGADKFARMRFDEIHFRLPADIPAGSTFKLVKTDANAWPYTIDFVELEPVPAPVRFENLPDADKVAYSTADGPLEVFIASHGGRTIYLPEGRYEVSERIRLNAPGTKLIGAGMWYTEIYFSSPSDRADTYSKRGIETDQDRIVLEGFSVNTCNNRRYYVDESGRNGQVGKGLMGSFGAGSTIRNVWIEHFECGAWIDGATELSILHCRFRNQYADGVNLSYGSCRSTVEHCSFRNNGDDDMASWSRGERMCEEITYRYNTAENNWRASSVGFFGGKGHRALSLVVIDPMEAALRVTTDFPGREFSSEGEIIYDDISVYRAGVCQGPLGFYGDFIDGSAAGAIHITSYLRYDLRNVRFSRIDLYDSKGDAIFLDCQNDKLIRDLYLENIRIAGSKGYGIRFGKAAGLVFYGGLVFEKIETGEAISPVPASLQWLSLPATGLPH